MNRNPHEESAEVLVRFCHADHEDATKCAHTTWKVKNGVNVGHHCPQFAGFAITAANHPGVVYRRCAQHVIYAVREAGTDWLNNQS